MGWGKKFETAFGLSCLGYTFSFMRGIDWKKSYFAFYVSYVTKDGKMEFTAGFYISTSHLLKLAVAVTVVGVCVVLPALEPALMTAVAALSAKAKTLVALCSSMLSELSCVAA